MFNDSKLIRNILAPNEGGGGAVKPLQDDAGFSYESNTPTARPIFDYLNQNIFDGQYPSSEYKAISNKILTVPDLESLQTMASEQQPDKNEVITIIVDPQLTSIGVADQQQIQSIIVIGEQFKSVLTTLIEKSESKEFSYGLDSLLDYNYLDTLNTLVSDGSYSPIGLDELTGFLKINAVINSFESCAQFLYDSIAQDGYLFESIQDVIIKIFDSTAIDSLIDTIEQIILSEEGETTLSFIEEGQAVISKVLDQFSVVLNYLPSLEFLFELFWERFNAFIEAHTKAFDFLMRFSLAKSRFEGAMILEAGTEIYAQICGPKGEEMLNSGGKFAELMIGGALFGSLPFVIGTIYQIIYDIINLVISLCKYAYWGVEGIVKWLFSAEKKVNDDMIAPDESLMKMFTFDFELSELPGMLKEISGHLVSFAEGAIENFLEHAEEYGTTAGKILGSGIITISSGALSLITSGYPPEPTLFNRYIYVIKQWFNIGCMIGPIVVDIVLMFCSGGASGIFSAAAKLGKLDKVGDAMRFVKKTKDLIEASGMYRTLTGLIPAPLERLLERLISQLWAISGKIDDQLKILLETVNKILKETGDGLSKRVIDNLAEKLDMWYDIGGAVDLFCALTFFFVGGPESQINEESKLVAS